MSIVKKHLQDSTPKAIMHLFVRKLSSSLNVLLISNLMKLDLEYVLREEDEIAGWRARLLREVEVGRSALVLCNKLIN